MYWKGRKFFTKLIKKDKSPPVYVIHLFYLNKCSSCIAWQSENMERGIRRCRIGVGAVYTGKSRQGKYGFIASYRNVGLKAIKCDEPRWLVISMVQSYSMTFWSRTKHVKKQRRLCWVFYSARCSFLLYCSSCNPSKEIKFVMFFDRGSRDEVRSNRAFIPNDYKKNKQRK